MIEAKNYKESLIMKKVLIIVSLLLFSAGALSHSGGCRKDSPQGQCCHAGSKPYHCH